MNHAQHIATPVTEVIDRQVSLGVWPQPATVEKHPDGTLVTFHQGPDGGYKPRLIKNQRALDRAYRSTRKYPINHCQVEIASC